MAVSQFANHSKVDEELNCILMEFSAKLYDFPHSTKIRDTKLLRQQLKSILFHLIYYDDPSTQLLLVMYESLYGQLTSHVKKTDTQVTVSIDKDTMNEYLSSLQLRPLPKLVQIGSRPVNPPGVPTDDPPSNISSRNNSLDRTNETKNEMPQLRLKYAHSLKKLDKLNQAHNKLQLKYHLSIEQLKKIYANTDELKADLSKLNPEMPDKTAHEYEYYMHVTRLLEKMLKMQKVPEKLTKSTSTVSSEPTVDPSRLSSLLNDIEHLESTFSTDFPWTELDQQEEKVKQLQLELESSQNTVKALELKTSMSSATPAAPVTKAVPVAMANTPTNTSTMNIIKLARDLKHAQDALTQSKYDIERAEQKSHDLQLKYTTIKQQYKQDRDQYSTEIKELKNSISKEREIKVSPEAIPIKIDIQVHKMVDTQDLVPLTSDIFTDTVDLIAPLECTSISIDTSDLVPIKSTSDMTVDTSELITLVDMGVDPIGKELTDMGCDPQVIHASEMSTNTLSVIANDMACSPMESSPNLSDMACDPIEDINTIDVGCDPILANTVDMACDPLAIGCTEMGTNTFVNTSDMASDPIEIASTPTEPSIALERSMSLESTSESPETLERSTSLELANTPKSLISVKSVDSMDSNGIILDPVTATITTIGNSSRSSTLKDKMEQLKKMTMQPNTSQLDAKVKQIKEQNAMIEDLQAKLESSKTMRLQINDQLKQIANLEQELNAVRSSDLIEQLDQQDKEIEQLVNKMIEYEEEIERLETEQLRIHVEYGQKIQLLNEENENGEQVTALLDQINTLKETIHFQSDKPDTTSIGTDTNPLEHDIDTCPLSEQLKESSFKYSEMKIELEDAIRRKTVLEQDMEQLGIQFGDQVEKLHVEIQEKQDLVIAYKQEKDAIEEELRGLEENLDDILQRNMELQLQLAG